MSNKIIHCESSIQNLLDIRFSSNIRYKIPNAYIFKDDWESDYFVLQHASGYSYEIEIKVTRADFFNDLKKIHKHQILKEGKYNKEDYHYVYDPITLKHVLDENGRDKKEYIMKVHEHTFRPNKFYYCVPEGLVTKEEVPDYAGLMYASDYSITTVKEAKFIHKEKLKFETKLCNKFYWYWKNTKNELEISRRYVQNLENELRELKKKINENSNK